MNKIIPAILFLIMLSLMIPYTAASSLPTCYADSSFAGFPASNGCDFNDSTRWESGGVSDPEWFVLNLTVLSDISAVKIHWSAAHFPTATAELRYWDGISWIHAANVAANPTGGSTVTYPFDSSARTDKIRLDSPAGTGGFLGMFEFQAIGSPASSPISGTDIVVLGLLVFAEFFLFSIGNLASGGAARTFGILSGLIGVFVAIGLWNITGNVIVSIAYATIAIILTTAAIYRAGD